MSSSCTCSSEEALLAFSNLNAFHSKSQVFIPAPIEKVYQAWNSFSYKGIGMIPKIVQIDQKGSGSDELIGCIRTIPFGIQEIITSVHPLQSITYQIIAGPFPTEKHRGLVQFQKTASGTVVTWECKFIPSWFSTIFLFGGYGLELIVSMIFYVLLHQLKYHMKQ